MDVEYDSHFKEWFTNLKRQDTEKAATNQPSGKILITLNLIGESMPRRSKSFDALVAERMKKPEFARCVVTEAIGTGDTVDEALRRAIRFMGITEFATKSGIKLQNVSAFVNHRRSFSHTTLSKCLAVFGLRFSATPIGKKGRRKVA